jgi:hypothetical protein
MTWAVKALDEGARRLGPAGNAPVRTDRRAGEAGNKSELFREMLRVYGAYRETGTFERSSATARRGRGRLGVTSEGRRGA